ncbi:MAG: nucleotidyltransferase family protein [Elusimicrobia bacterium]|nr:nucleotidyltransferase family protein [Elusimicrobiota bacterium]
MKEARVLLLAAGHGKRAGGPKAWGNHGSTTLLEAHLDFFREFLAPSDISMAIQNEWGGRCRSISPDTTWVPADPDASPLDSLQKLIAASPLVRSFVLHVDMPVFDRSVYESLWNVEGDAIVPTYERRRGHPVLLSPSAMNEIKRLNPLTDRLDSWLRQRTTLEVAVATNVILRNDNERVS